MNIFGKRSDLPFSRKSDRKKEKAWFHLRMSRILFTEEKTIICKQFFCRSHGGFSAKEKEERFATNENSYY